MIRSVVLIAFLAASLPTLQAAERDRAKNAASGALSTFGSEEAMNAKAFEPLSTDAQMHTVSGDAFGAQVSCPASQEFMRLTMLPDGNGDLSSIGVELDSDFDGGFDLTSLHTGPFGGVCNNGVISCEPGTATNCRFLAWRSDNGALSLEEVGYRDLGACYCINNACGNNLVHVNSQKVLDDLGTAIGRQLQQDYPRLNMGRSEYPDPLSLIYYGAQAGCSTDARPEQYRNDVGALQDAGSAELNNPDSELYFLTQSDVAQQHRQDHVECEIDRQTSTDATTTDEIIEILSRSEGSVQVCGPECRIFHLGRPFSPDDYWAGPENGSGSDCPIYTQQQRFSVNRPDLVRSATHTTLRYDDSSQVIINSNVVYSDPANWTNPTGPVTTRCERGNSARDLSAIDLTSHFTSGGVVEQQYRVAVGGHGEIAGLLEVHVEEACELQEEVRDQCSAAENNPACRLRHEWVDDVQTVRDFYSTGLTPLPTSRVPEGECDHAPIIRDWWEKRRVYSCRSEEPPYDGTAAEERYQTIHSSFDSDTGAYNDRRRQDDGSYATSSHSLPLPPPDDAACEPMCKTRKRRPGSAVGEFGAVSDSNADGIAYDFSYKECTASGSVCPLDDGEELLRDCDCRSNFAEAATMMQTIRMMAQDTQCVP